MSVYKLQDPKAARQPDGAEVQQQDAPSVEDPLVQHDAEDDLTDPLATQMYGGPQSMVDGAAGAPGGTGNGGSGIVQASGGSAVQFGVFDAIGDAWNAVTGGGDSGGAATAKTEGEKQFELSEKFAGKLKYGDPYRYVPPTGIGGFDTEYWPLNGPDGWEKVIMRAKVKFINPVKMSGKNAVPFDASEDGAKDIAKGINKMPEGKRKAAVAKYTWGGEKSKWIKGLESVVFSAWSFKHSFRMEKPGWKWLGADPSVDLTVSEGAKAADDHLEVRAFKLPPGTGWGSYVAGDDRGQEMELGSNDIARDMPSNAKVFFPNGSAALDATALDTIEMFTRTYQGDPTHAASVKNKITLIGRTSASGSSSSNSKLAQQRIDAIKGQLTKEGWSVATRVEESNRGESEADPSNATNPDDQAVEMVVQGEGQTVAVHEFGHAFGLLDEYANKDKKGKAGWISGTGGTAGLETGHSKLAKKAGVKAGSIYENSENIMSVGDKVKPQHYATFHDALCKATGKTEWKLGKAITKKAAKSEITPAKDKSKAGA